MVVGIVVICVLVLLLFAAAYTIAVFNRMSMKKMLAEGMYVKMDDLFIRRYELLPELFALCSESFPDECGAVAALRESAISSKTADERAEHDAEMSDRLVQLLASCADSGRLAAQPELAQLSERLEKLANEIGAACKEYNSAADDYNTMRGKFPASVVARSFSFEEKPIFRNFAPQNPENILTKSS